MKKYLLGEEKLICFIVPCIVRHHNLVVPHNLINIFLS